MSSYECPCILSNFNCSQEQILEIPNYEIFNEEIQRTFYFYVIKRKYIGSMIQVYSRFFSNYQNLSVSGECLNVTYLDSFNL